ncbi:WD40-repeat-containing domain protein [Rhypophila decipiens]
MAPKKNKLGSRLQNSYLLSPITALDIYHAQPGRSLVLAGEDTYLKVYHAATSKQLGRVKIFHSQPIHGIHVSQTNNTETRILIWGGQSVSILPQASLQTLIQGGHVQQPRELKAPDWIYDGILSPYDPNSGVLVTAHNEIVPLRSTPDGQVLTFGPLTSPSRPILYSANLSWLSAESVLVAGGTVFGEIIVWKYYTSPTSERPSQWELLYVFTGHEGSIFGVSISPEIELAPGTKIRVLASCSDDRTIRIWDITDSNCSTSASTSSTNENGPSNDPAKALADARETGFGGNSNSEANEEHQNDSARCLAVAMGHVSRIWHVKFTGRTNHDSPREMPIDVWSFGEDCARQRWELRLDIRRWEDTKAHNYITTKESAPIGILKHCSTSPCHVGKNIWSAAVSMASEEEQPLVVSGGADGKIAISGGQSKSENGTFGSNYDDMELVLSVSDVLQSVGAAAELGDLAPEKQAKKSAKEGFQRYAFLSEQSFLATTTSGRLLTGTTAKDNITWENVDMSETVMQDLKSWNIIKSPAKGLAVLGSGSGKIYFYQQSRPNTIQELTQLPNKVSDIICLEDPSMRKQPNTWTIIATVLALDHAFMSTFETNPTTGETRQVSSRRIDLTPNFVITAAAFCNGKLILGSRIGVLAVQRPKGSDGFETEQSRKDCKTKDAVTCIIPLPGSTDSFLAGCRDGRYRIYTLDKDLLHLQHEISPPLGMIEGAWFTSSPISTTKNPELTLYGFRGNNFIVWSETSRQELASVECGGAHRPFDTISPAHNPGQLKLVFTKAAQMHFYSQGRQFLRALKDGGHGRELRAVAASASGSKYRYVATAAEDTTIRIWQIDDTTTQASNNTYGMFKPLAVLEKHSAGIQQLKWHGDSYLLSSGGQEEFFIWRVTRLESEYESLAVVCEAVFDDKSEDGDLRIMDFDVSPLTGNIPRDGKGEEEEKMIISLALSNSSIKTYIYSPSERGFRLLFTGRYTGACLTQIRHLDIDVDSIGDIHVLTGSTDGFVGFWSASFELREGYLYPAQFEYELDSVVKLHQSTLKSLDIAPAPDAHDRGWLVATGGDDNALGFMRVFLEEALNYEWEVKRSITVVNRARVAGAHAAAITGLAFVQTSHSEQQPKKEEAAETRQFLLATASNDQRVKLWKVELRGVQLKTPPKVSLLDNQYSSVADTGDVEVIPPSAAAAAENGVGGGARLMVGGVGMEVWDLV